MSNRKSNSDELLFRLSKELRDTKSKTREKCAWFIIDWLVRIHPAMYLKLCPGLQEEAEELLALDPMHSPDALLKLYLFNKSFVHKRSTLFTKTTGGKFDQKRGDDRVFRETYCAARIAAKFPLSEHAYTIAQNAISEQGGNATKIIGYVSNMICDAMIIATWDAAKNHKDIQKETLQPILDDVQVSIGDLVSRITDMKAKNNE